MPAEAMSACLDARILFSQVNCAPPCTSLPNSGRLACTVWVVKAQAMARLARGTPSVSSPAKSGAKPWRSASSPLASASESAE